MRLLGLICGSRSFNFARPSGRGLAGWPVVITGLAAVSVVLSAPHVVHPRDGNEKDAVAFAVIGDSGTGQKPQFQIARQMSLEHDKVPFGLVLMLGDNIYPDGNPALFKSKFEEPYKELLAHNVVFHAVLGNHDAEKGSTAEMDYERFGMKGRRYYSFTEGDGLIEFFGLDSTSVNKDQLSWLDDALKSSKARWKVVFSHHPMYCSARKHGSDAKLREIVAPLLVKYGVDAAFAGHDHVYERVKPQDGVHFFVEGASGQLRKGNLDRADPLFEAGDDSDNSFLVVQVDKARMKIEAIDSAGKVIDSVQIDKH